MKKSANVKSHFVTLSWGAAEQNKKELAARCAPNQAENKSLALLTRLALI
jgi:hypothetical protein